MYQREREQIKNLFETSPFIDGLRSLEDHSSKAWAKLCHVENVAKLMEAAAEEEGFSEKERLMAFTAGQFHDIAYINDVMLTGKKSGPQHGARGAIITFGILTQYYQQGFNRDDIKIITTAIANHDGATPTELDGFTKKLTFLLRDCDKVDCYRRLSTESLENVFQKPLQFDGRVRQDFANGCLSGKPMEYAEMQNFNEEVLLYLGWFFQLNSISCQKIACRFFEAFAERMLQVTTDAEAKFYIGEALKKARSIGESSH